MGIKGIVDRIEGEWVAVELENGKMKDFPKVQFPKKIKPGDAVIHCKNRFEIDKERTNDLKKEIDGLMDDLFID